MKCVWEHNGNDTLLYSVDYVGAYTRGNSLESAIIKMKSEIAGYSFWRGLKNCDLSDITIIQEKDSSMQISDADSDILFDSEKEPLTREEYNALRDLVLKSAMDFHKLYASIQNKDESCLQERKTFYGYVPRTAREMYEHTRSVNSYYFGEIGIEADNEGAIYECRKRGFEALEKTNNFLKNVVIEGSYGESWSLRKVMRRFIWHDRIHAKAMYRMAMKTFGEFGAKNIFHFGVE